MKMYCFQRPLLILVALMLSVASWAAPRSAAHARILAMQFMGVSSNDVVKAQHRKPASNDQAPYYIFNVERPNGGFVVVSGDDRFADILGYSQSGTFDEEKPLPDGLRYWLNTLEAEMKHALANGFVGGPRRANSAVRSSVEPLLTTQWTQETPFNNDCPMSDGVRSVAGCVAVGMAQIINYWKQLPETYDYDNILDVYNRGLYTEAQASAVAKLVSDCGAAVNMNYGSAESGAAGEAATSAYVTRFKFNKFLHNVVRDCTTFGVYKDIILEELGAKHPIPMSGNDKDGTSGHYFVLDGYDAKQDLFHFNWGWGGYLDGYFALTALNPGGGGTGAGAGDFNYHQFIVAGLQPEVAGEQSYLFVFDEISPNNAICNRGPGIGFTITNFANYAVNFTGEVGVAAYDAEGNFISANTSTLDSSFRPGYFYTSYQIYTPNFGATKFPYGEYDLYPVVKRTRDDNYYRMQSYYGHADHVHMVVSPEDNKVHFSVPEMPKVQLSDNNQAPILVGSDDKTVYVGQPAEFQITLTNKGDAEFYDEVGVMLSYGIKAVNTQYILSMQRLAPGETKTINICGYINVESTNVQYSVAPVYGVNGVYSKLYTQIAVNVKNGSDGVEIVRGENNPRSADYDLSGRKASTDYRGIVVRGGRKVKK